MSDFKAAGMSCQIIKSIVSVKAEQYFKYFPQETDILYINYMIRKIYNLVNVYCCIQIKELVWEKKKFTLLQNVPIY